jgi:SpoVK/Ycf46/Vps4 family AAA+-type ATPase
LGKMRILRDGPFEDTCLLKVQVDKEESFYSGNSMGDIHSLRICDSIMKSNEGAPSAIVFLQSETTLRYFEDPRSLAGIIGEWNHLPDSNQNLCIFLFSADNKEQLCNTAPNIPIPEIRNMIMSNSRNMIELLGPRKQETSDLLKSICKTQNIPIQENEYPKLVDWIIAEGGKASLWRARLRQLNKISLETFRKTGWFSAIQNTTQTGREKLDGLVGLENIKERVNELTAWAAIQKLRTTQETKPALLHLIFSGNPGTGKTTIARLIGEILHEIGVLNRGHLVEVKAVDLIADHVGGTALKTNGMIDSAREGVLFIDEAYMLCESDRGGFAQEALDTLLTRMDQSDTRFVVILAGYTNKMQRLLLSNPGLSRRFPSDNRFTFPDYSENELSKILENIIVERKMALDPDCSEKLKIIIGALYSKRDEHFGNAGEIINLVDAMERKWSHRIFNSNLPLNSSLEFDDIPTKFLSLLPAKMPSLDDLLGDLDLLTGLVPVKSFLRRLVHALQVDQMRQKFSPKKDVIFNLQHLIFLGNPGTGKTTVARILGRIYQCLGLLPNGHLVEVSRQDLVAGYVGQTALQTKAKIQEAQGGILFIDEAYSLFRDSAEDFGREALDTLVKGLEDYRGRFVVILAGYPFQMNELLQSNPGLLSRFTQPIPFPDFDMDQLIEIFETKCTQEGFNVEFEIFEEMKRVIELNRIKRGSSFGNARFIYELFNQMKACQAERIMKSEIKPDQEEFDPAELFMLKIVDVPDPGFSGVTLKNSINIDKVKQFTASYKR